MYERLIKTFPGYYGDTREPVDVEVYQSRDDTTDSAVRSCVGGTKRLQIRNGEDLNRIDKGRYEGFDSERPVHSDDPNAE